MVTQKVDKNDENLGFFHRWLEEFAKFTDGVRVIALQEGVHSLPKNVSVFTFGKRNSRIAKLWKFWELFSYHYARTDAVFFHMIPEYVMAAAPFLVSLKKPSGLWYVHKSVTPTLRWAERMVDWIFTASELSFRLPSLRVLYTGHAIDTGTFRPIPNSQFPVSSSGIRLLILGRISPVKDIETAIRACEVLKNTWQRAWTLSIVGGPLMPRDNDYLESLKKMVKEKQLEHYVSFHGSIPYNEVPSAYLDHDIFISMSTTGSMDKSVLEAMSSGLTIITANEAFKSLLPETYFLETRSPEFLAEHIKILADEPRPNLTLRRLVEEKHGLENTIQKIINAYTKF